MVNKFFKDKIPHNGFTYEEYKNMIRGIIESTDPAKLNLKDRELFAYRKLNYQRSGRIEKQYSVSDELVEEIKKIKDKQIWMVITETWCGDSAQNLPYIAKIAALNSKIDLRIILRDEHLEVMDNYLTNGTRSIPKLVVFDTYGNELLNWGPRPKEVQSLFEQWKSEGIVSKELYEKLHLWYGRNKGKNLEEEMLQRIKTIYQEIL